MGEPFRHTLRVRYAEADAQGVLFNAHYLAYVDHTITELWRTAFGGYQEMLRRGVDIVVAQAGLSFRAPARFDDEVTVELRVVHLGTTSLRTESGSCGARSCSPRRSCVTCSWPPAPRTRRRSRIGPARAWRRGRPARRPPAR